MKEITMYIAEDGATFSSKEECLEHEKKELQKVYEVEYEVDIILRLDGVRLKLEVPFTGNDEVLFRDIAMDEIYDTDNHLTAGELLGIAANQGIYPYLDEYVNEDIIGKKEIQKKG